MPCTKVSSRENSRDLPHEHRVVSSLTPPELPPGLQATKATLMTAVRTSVHLKTCWTGKKTQDIGIVYIISTSYGFVLVDDVRPQPPLQPRPPSPLIAQPPDRLDLPSRQRLTQLGCCVYKDIRKQGPPTSPSSQLLRDR
jgi:hypothetical protein